MLEQYDPETINAIVLLTDGMNDDGTLNDDDEQFATLIETLEGPEGESATPVRVFTIAYGDDADDQVLRQISQASSAATYNASNPATIEQVFTAVISNF
jgi:Ca-activated chloride channel family protein